MLNSSLQSVSPQPTDAYTHLLYTVFEATLQTPQQHFISCLCSPKCSNHILELKNTSWGAFVSNWLQSKILFLLSLNVFPRCPVPRCRWIFKEITVHALK